MLTGFSFNSQTKAADKADTDSDCIINIKIHNILILMSFPGLTLESVHHTFYMDCRVTLRQAQEPPDNDNYLNNENPVETFEPTLFQLVACFRVCGFFSVFTVSKAEIVHSAIASSFL